MRAIYLILICFAAPVAALIAAVRGARDSSRRERLRDRLGRPEFTAGPPTIWLHAASMGEVQAGAVLVRQLLERYPQHRVIVTTMTATGAARVRALFGARVTHCFVPYDLPAAVRGFLDRAQPRMAIILETELWPELLRECAKRGVPILIGSARISPRTADRYRRLSGLFRPVLKQGAVVAAQSGADAERYRALGAGDVRVTGNLKFDIDIPAAVQEAAQALRAQIGNRFIWVAGSTHSGEEEAALLAHSRLLSQKPDALLILVPRHPQRFDDVRGLLTSSGLRFVARSANALPKSSDAVLLGDTMGELLGFYGAADLVFVGGSLVPVGGHNLLEPAALGIAVLTGPHQFATQEIADLILQAGAAEQVNSAEGLAAAVSSLAVDAERRLGMGRQGRATVLQNRGAVARLMELIAERLPGESQR